MFGTLKNALKTLKNSKHYLDAFDNNYKKKFINEMNVFYNDEKNHPFINEGFKKEIQLKIMYDKDTKTIKIAFESSRSNRINKKCFLSWDWIGNLAFFPLWSYPYKDMKIRFRTHLGFTIIWKSVEDYIKANLDIIIKRNPEVEKIWIFGWSQGGATAQFCHEFCGYNYPQLETTTMTIGSPKPLYKIFNLVKKAAIVKRFERLIMIANNNDIVPKAPFGWMGFEHIVPVFKVGDKFNIIKIFNPFKYHMNTTYLECVNAL